MKNHAIHTLMMLLLLCNSVSSKNKTKVFYSKGHLLRYEYEGGPRLRQLYIQAYTKKGKLWRSLSRSSLDCSLFDGDTYEEEHSIAVGYYHDDLRFMYTDIHRHGTNKKKGLAISYNSKGRMNWHSEIHSPVALSKFESVTYNEEGKALASGVIGKNGFLNDEALPNLSNANLYGILVQFDLQGNKDWVFTLPNSRIIRVLSLSKTKEYFLMGFTSDVSTAQHRMFIAKLDQNGNLLWIKYEDENINTNDIYGANMDMQFDKKGNIFTCHVSIHHEQEHVIELRRYNYDGEELWRKEVFQKYDLSDGKALFMRSIMSTRGGNVMVGVTFTGEIFAQDDCKMRNIDQLRTGVVVGGYNKRGENIFYKHYHGDKAFMYLNNFYIFKRKYGIVGCYNGDIQTETEELKYKKMVGHVQGLKFLFPSDYKNDFNITRITHTDTVMQSTQRNFVPEQELDTPEQNILWSWVQEEKLLLTLPKVSEQANVKIYNYLGLEVYSQNGLVPSNTELYVDLPQLHEGVYILNVEVEGKNHTVKFIK